MELRTRATLAAAVAVLALVGSSCRGDDVAPTAAAPSSSDGAARSEPSAATSVESTTAARETVAPTRAAESVEPRPEPPAAQDPPAPARPDLLQPAGGGDGDSWHDTDGIEYRLGLVNAPEVDECYGSQATAKRKELTAAGFHAHVYTRDSYGRSVAVVALADGTNLNVWLARHGYVNDRYLERYRHENSALAAELDGAFAAAKAERAGLWGACTSSHRGTAAVPPPPPSPTTQPIAAPGDGCHPDYLTCIPVQGDGSGAGGDLDCGDIRRPVELRRISVDPYRLDREGDGVGCESY